MVFDHRRSHLIRHVDAPTGSVKGGSVYLLVVVCALCLGLATDVEARKKALDSKTGATASIKIKTQDANLIADALVEVFSKDGYELVFEAPQQMNFARQASRMQELAYGKPLSPGSMEMVYVDFYPLDDSKYKVECRVSIRGGAESSLADSNVLPLFGRQYKRMLRRVNRAVKRKR